ncbi:MAG: lipocalin family protein [Bdellovibrionales bacterium]|nr:lipocalin family protein [Bdellovibrionales bacterium]
MLKSKLVFLFLLVCGGFASADPLTTVDHVDLTLYVGKWYEIASIPQYFQRKCVSDTTAEYEIIGKNRVRVYNSCETEDHRRIASEGRAKVVDTETNAKLKVTFAHIGDNYFYTFGGKYWITYLDSNYRYAIVGHPNRKYGWILSREPSLPESTLHMLITELKMRGYDACQFMMTPQKGGYSTRGSLCDLVSVDTLEQEL